MFAGSGVRCVRYVDKWVIQVSDFIGPRALIDLSAVRSNYRTISSIVNQGVTVSAVVKSDAYGLGAVQVAKAVYSEGCRDFWVAYLSEALELSAVLPDDANIYYLQGFQKSDIASIKQTGVIPVINSIDDFGYIVGTGVRFVLHVDSGLSRLGVRPDDIDKILPDLENERISYVISHLACSDEPQSSQNLAQKLAFERALEKIRSRVSVRAGISATGGTFLGRNFSYDMVRIGAFLYGIDVGAAVHPKNVLTVESSVLQKYTLPAGRSIGYGSTYITREPIDVAVISIGYADGLKRSLSNRGYVGFYVDGGFYKAPIVGNISMDLTVCDVTGIPCVAPGTTATILGPDYSVNEMAKDAGVIPYEVLSSINLSSKRFAMSYLD